MYSHIGRGLLILGGRNSSVGIATRYGPDGPGSNPGGSEIFRIRPDRPWAPPSLLYNGYMVFPAGKAAGAWSWPSTPHLQCPGFKKGTAIPLPTLRAWVAYKGGTFIDFRLLNSAVSTQNFVHRQKRSVQYHEYLLSTFELRRRPSIKYILQNCTEN